MGVPIFNASSVPLDQNSGTLPNVGDAMLDYFQAMTFSTVVKAVQQGGTVVETPTPVTFQGVWQPLSPRAVEMKPEGQRKWNWYRCHADPSLGLKPDDVVTYLGVQYRVMGKWDFSLYGYNEYQLVDDYSGVGP